MLREAALDTKRRELSNCVGSRKRKLSELYNVSATVTTKTTRGLPQTRAFSTTPASASLNESQFQDENDILQGKYFNKSQVARFTSRDKYQEKSSAAARSPGRRVAVDDRISSKSRVSPPAEQKPHRDGLASIERVSSNGQEAIDGGIADIPTPPKSTTRGHGVEDQVSTHPEDGSLATNKNATLLSSFSAEGVDNPDLRPQVPDARNVAGHSESGMERFPDLDTTTTDSKLSANYKADPFVEEPKHAEDAGNGYSTHLHAKEDSSEHSRNGTIASRRQGSEVRYNGLASQEAGDSGPSQKTPIRIDTGVAQNRTSTDFSASITSLTPLRSAQTALQSSPPERMTTRVSSGALRHKSVSEILGETPKVSPSQAGPTPTQETSRDDFGHAFRRGSLIASPDSVGHRARNSETKDRDKERSKLSAVVFARQKGHESNRSGEVQSALRKEKSEEDKDYLVPLFAAQASAQTPTLSHLISSAHKTLTTANHYVDYHESQDCRILKRIYHLQNSNRWSLRQLERAAEPNRPTTQWDALLAEVKWLRTDFREERKWKVIAAQNLAHWCAEWVAMPKHLRATVQVKCRSYRSRPTSQSESCQASHSICNERTEAERTPDLIESFEGDLSEPSEDDMHVELVKMPVPATLFSLGREHITFGLAKTPISDELLSELPQYQPFLSAQDSDLSLSEIVDSTWRKPIVPVSKHAIGKIVIQEEGPRRKKSRYQYSLEDEENESTTPPQSLQKTAIPLPPEQDDVALFSPRNKHIIQRLHATHAFRPPSQHPMPSQQFFEFRHSSQWTVAEDDELRRLVREYEYNWHLISECMCTKSLFSSGAERRTPWECFERWESFEGLPGDMDKHSYFRTWRSRRQNAKHQLEQRFLLQQQSGVNAQLMRRKSAEPVHVEKRKHDKPYALLGAVSKVVKRRETLLQKQQHGKYHLQRIRHVTNKPKAAQLAAFRKQPEVAPPRLRMQTPQEFSAHKHKQEVEFKEKQMIYRQQLDQNKRLAFEQSRGIQQGGRNQPGLAVPQQNRLAIAASMNAANQRSGANIAQGGMQTGGRPFPSQNLTNGAMPNGPAVPLNRQQSMVGASGVSVPQAQMQGYMQGQNGPIAVQQGQDATRVMSEAMRLSEQQRLMQRQVRNQPNGYGMPGHPSAHNAMMGNVQHTNKLSTANGIAGSQQRSSASPSMPSSTHAQQLSSGMVPLLNQITNQLKASHPNATSEEIKKMATRNLNIHLHNQNAQASSKPNGTSSNANIQMQQQQQSISAGPNGSAMNQQMYAQFIRSHQASQQNLHTLSGNSPNMANGGENARPGSRGTPGSQSRASATANAPSSSPRPPQAQMAGSPP